jgi:hypothetical protein
MIQKICVLADTMQEDADVQGKKCVVFFRNVLVTWKLRYYDPVVPLK